MDSKIESPESALHAGVCCGDFGTSQQSANPRGLRDRQRQPLGRAWFGRDTAPGKFESQDLSRAWGRAPGAAVDGHSGVIYERPETPRSPPKVGRAVGSDAAILLRPPSIANGAG